MALSAYQQELRDRFLAAPVTAAPPPWRRVAVVPVGGLVGVGFGPDPVDGRDLLMVVSHGGHGVFDAATGARVAWDRAPDPDGAFPDNADLSCPGLGPLAGRRIVVAGLFGGGLRSSGGDGWTVDVVSPEWPHNRVLLSADGGLNRGPAGGSWWVLFDADCSELRAAGFSPGGSTLTVATSSDVTLWTRNP